MLRLYHCQACKETDMALSEAEASLNTVKFDSNSDIDLHVAELCTKELAVNDLHTVALTNQEFCGIIINSILTTDPWKSILPSLYQMPTSSDIFSHLQTHAATLHTVGKGPAQSQALVAGLPSHSSAYVPCSILSCKAQDKTKHMSENCYWPGGG